MTIDIDFQNDNGQRQRLLRPLAVISMKDLSAIQRLA